MQDIIVDFEKEDDVNVENNNAPFSPRVVHVIYSGLLVERVVTWKYIKRWIPRYVRIKAHRIEMYATETSLHPMKSIPLTQETIISTTSSSRSFSFGVLVRKDAFIPICILAASSSNQVEKWIEAITQHILNMRSNQARHDLTQPKKEYEYDENGTRSLDDTTINDDDHDDAISKSSINVGTIDQQYQLLETMGEGSFAVVRKGIHRSNGDSVAIKSVPLTLAVHEEIKLWKEVNNYNNINNIIIITRNI